MLLWSRWRAPTLLDMRSRSATWSNSSASTSPSPFRSNMRKAISMWRIEAADRVTKRDASFRRYYRRPIDSQSESRLVRRFIPFFFWFWVQVFDRPITRKERQEEDEVGERDEARAAQFQEDRVLLQVDFFLQSLVDVLSTKSKPTSALRAASAFSSPHPPKKKEKKKPRTALV